MTAFLTLALPLVAYAERGLRAPERIDLTGVWTIDRERSDDPKEPQDSARKEGKKPIRVRVDGGLGALGDLIGVSGRMGDRIQQQFAAGERIEILQLQDSVDLKYAAHYVSCTSTAKTRMSLPDGRDAHRSCGWEGNEFVVEIQDSKGHTRTDRFSRGDSDALVVKTTIKSERMPERELEIVYLRSDSN